MHHAVISLGGKKRVKENVLTFQNGISGVQSVVGSSSDIV